MWAINLLALVIGYIIIAVSSVAGLVGIVYLLADFIFRRGRHAAAFGEYYLAKRRAKNNKRFNP